MIFLWNLFPIPLLFMITEHLLNNSLCSFVHLWFFVYFIISFFFGLSVSFSNDSLLMDVVILDDYYLPKNKIQVLYKSKIYQRKHEDFDVWRFYRSFFYLFWLLFWLLYWEVSNFLNGETNVLLFRTKHGNQQKYELQNWNLA